MQIQNNYNSFSGREYHNSHTHHITKCLHEEGHHRKETAAAAIKQDAASSGTGQKAQEDTVSLHGSSVEKKAIGLKKGLGGIRGLWDSLGEEKSGKTAGTLVMGREHSAHEGINVLSSIISLGFSYRIANKWESIREKLKVNIKAALKRFGKDSDTFAALADPKGRSAGKKDQEEQYTEKAGTGTRRKAPDIMTADLSDTHLMDSYSKTGEYCRLNENLTYQKNKALERGDNQSGNQPPNGE